MVKLKLIRVTNMSVSSRISCTDGGGKAMANATIPNTGGLAFLACENVYCGRNRHNINTTYNCGTEKKKSFYLCGRLDGMLWDISFRQQKRTILTDANNSRK